MSSPHRSGAAAARIRAREVGTGARLRHTGRVRLAAPPALVFALVSVAVFALGAAPGLGCSSPARPVPDHPGPARSAARTDDPTCPVLVAGTSVTVEDTDTGAAFVFVTTGDAAAVRTRARALAEEHNARHAKMEPGAAHDGHDAHGAHGAGTSAKPMTMGTMIGAHSTAAVTDIPGGARVAFTAHDPAALQSELRMHAQHLAGGSCEM